MFAAEIERAPRSRLSTYLLLLITGATLIAVRIDLRRPVVDFEEFYVAAQMIRHGDAAKLYDFPTQATYETKYVHPEQSLPVPTNPFLYPASTAILFVPLTALSLESAWSVWLGINLLLVLASVRLLQTALSLPQDDGPLMVALVGAPVIVGLWIGQVCFLLLALWSFSFVAMCRKHVFLAGLAIGFTALKFQLMFAFVIILLLRRSWKTLAGVVVGATAMGVVSGAVVGWHQLLAYPEFLQHAAYHRRVALPMIMPNVRGVLALAIGAEPPVWLVAVISGSAVLWASTKWTNTARGFALGLTISVLTTYHAYVQELTLLLIPLAIAVDGIEWNRSRAAAILLAVLVVNGVLYAVGAQAAMGLFSALLLLGLFAARDRRVAELASVRSSSY